MPRNNDTVRLRHAIPAESLPEGALGAVVAEFTDPEEAYEIEFVDSNGATICQLPLKPDQFDVVSTGAYCEPM